MKKPPTIQRLFFGQKDMTFSTNLAVFLVAAKFRSYIIIIKKKEGAAWLSYG